MNLEIFSFLKDILFYLRPFWKRFLLGTIFAILASVATGFSTWAIKPIFNFIFVEKNYEYFKFVPLFIIFVFCLVGLFSFLQAYFMRSVSIKVVNYIRLNLFQKCLYIPVEKLSYHGSGQIISRVINDTIQIEPILGYSFQTLIKEIFTVCALLIVAFYQRWDLTLLTLSTLPIIALGTKLLGIKTRKARKIAQFSTGELTQRMNEIVNGIKEIKISGTYQKVNELFSKELNKFYRWTLRITKYRQGAKSLVDLVNGFGGALVIGYGGYLIIKGYITPGGFLSVFTALFLIFNPIRKLVKSYTGLKEAQGAWVRLKEVMKLENEKGGNIKAFPPKKGFYLKNVSFKYAPHLPFALKNINIFIPANKIIALVGSSGAGKSTLVSLLPRLYDPQKGEIYLDDIPLKNFDIWSLRNLFGLVPQEPFLFNLSIWENLIMVKPEATEEEVIEACKLAMAHEFITKLPKGYHTVLGEEGFSLSGGQKQRLALARIFLKKPPIIILDEATSQLDSLTELAIQSALERLKNSHTIIIIAHRLSTIKRADKIFVLDQGEIVAEGIHEKLLQKSPLYKNLYQSFYREELISS